jgi:hypothetical protein
MTYSGTVVQGRIVLDDDPKLPDGAQVEVQVLERSANPLSLRERLLKLAGSVDDLPSDMARNHDHYIHGASKR